MFNKKQIRIQTVLWVSDIPALYLISYLNPCPLLLIEFAYSSDIEHNRSEPLGRVTYRMYDFFHNKKIYYSDVYVLYQPLFFSVCCRKQYHLLISPFSTKIFSVYCNFIIVGFFHKQTMDVKQADFWWVWSIFPRKTKTKQIKLTLEPTMR